MHFKSKSLRNAQKQWVEHNQKIIDPFITNDFEIHDPSQDCEQHSPLKIM